MPHLESSQSSRFVPQSSPPSNPRARALAALASLVAEAGAAGDLALARTLSRMLGELLDVGSEDEGVIEFSSRTKRRP